MRRARSWGGLAATALTLSCGASVATEAGVDDGARANTRAVGPQDANADDAAEAHPGSAQDAHAGSAQDANEGGAPDAHAGSAQDANDGTTCSGSVSFLMTSAGGTWFYSFSGDEEPNWLTVLAGDGSQLAIVPSENDLTNCVDGGDFTVPIGDATGTVPEAGVTGSWNGVYYAQGPNACVTPTCAAPGHYIARMCGCSSSSTEGGSGCAFGDSDADCLMVPFTYPSAAPVVGTLPSAP